MIMGITITLWDRNELDPKQGAIFELDVLYNDAEHRPLRGNLVPHLTKAQIQTLQTLIADLRAQAESQILS